MYAPPGGHWVNADQTSYCPSPVRVRIGSSSFLGAAAAVGFSTHCGPLATGEWSRRGRLAGGEFLWTTTALRSPHSLVSLITAATCHPVQWFGVSSGRGVGTTGIEITALS